MDIQETAPEGRKANSKRGYRHLGNRYLKCKDARGKTSSWHTSVKTPGGRKASERGKPPVGGGELDEPIYNTYETERKEEVEWKEGGS